MKHTKQKPQSEYTREVVGTARFHIEEGMYSIPELEQMLFDFKKASAVMDEHLAQTMKEVNQTMKKLKQVIKNEHIK
jgi:hypothetical protein